ncbi:hypothetical protein BH23GEM3_BH23GEM3_14020 [soil metagenome]
MVLGGPVLRDAPSEAFDHLLLEQVITHKLALLLSTMLMVTAACAPVDPDIAASGNESASEAAPPTNVVEAAPPPPQAAENPDRAGYRASGNEPFWTMTFGQTTMDFSELGDENTGSAIRPDPERLANGWRFTARSGERPFIAEIQERRCNDSMSGRPFPHTVTVTVHGQTYTGCGGDTAGLLTGDEWRVTRLESAETTGRRPPTLLFAADGALTGDGGCNLFRATYEITGEGIQIGPALATRMACVEPELNSQETQFFTLLEQATRFDIAEDGSLKLYVMDRPVIVARR